MELNYLAILVATVLQFVWGWIWYMPLFGKTWGTIHGFNSKSPEEQARMQKEMMPLMVTQIIVTFITTFVFALLAGGLPASWSLFGLAGFFWIGFIVPTQIAAVIFSETPRYFMVKKSLIMAGASFFCMEIIATVLHFMG